MKPYKEPKEKDGGSLKKRETCKGGRPHDWVEVLPYGMEAIEGVYQGDTEPYYLGLKAIKEFEQHIYEELEKIGIKQSGRHFSVSDLWHDRSRPYMCSVCHKKDYRNKND